MQNAKITLRNDGTEETRTALTDQDGSYRFSLLPPGKYELTVEAVGFAPIVVREVAIQITEMRSIATQLSVKGVREEVVSPSSASTDRQRRTRKGDCSRDN